MEEHAQVVVDPDTQRIELIGITANISARKRAEEALQASEELNRSTLQALPAHVAVINRLGKIVAVNSAWSEFAANNAAESGAITTVGSSYLDVCRRSFAEDGEAARALAGIEAVLDGSENYFSMEYACHAPKEQRWFLMIAAPFQSQNQKGAVISHLNITDRKKAEIALRESENFSRSVLESSPDCVKVLSCDGNIEFMNHNGQTQLDIDDISLSIGRPWVSFWPEKTRPTVASAIASAKSGVETHFEAASSTMKGTLKWWDVVVSPILDENGECRRIMSVSRDVSERKRVEAALMTSLDRLETAEYATNALNYDTRGGAVWRGPGLTRVLGWQQNEVPATIEGWLGLLHPDDLPANKAVEVMPSADGANRFAHEYRVRHKDGHYVWLMDRGRKEYDADGNLSGIVGASFDITSRRLTEEALRDSEARFTRASALARFGAYEYDVAANRTKWSLGFMTLVGRDEVSEVSLESFLNFLHADDQVHTSQAFEAVTRKIGSYEMEYRMRLPNGGEIWMMDRGETFGPVDPETGFVSRAVGMVLDITERKKSENRQSLLMNELNHRVKNTLATVQSMASQTLRTSPNMAEAKVRFEARLMALSKVHDVLTREKWESAPFAEIVDRAIFPYRGSDADRFTAKGPSVRISSSLALTFAMTLHELCTNAVKYGALSNDKGKVEITWTVSTPKKLGPILKFRWSEKGGPTVKTPTTRGFGTKLIERSLASDLGGTVNMNFAKTGVTCIITTKVDHASEQLETENLLNFVK